MYQQSSGVGDRELPKERDRLREYPIELISMCVKNLLNFMNKTYLAHTNALRRGAEILAHCRFDHFP